MLRRYAIATLIILLVAGATAGATYAFGSKLSYNALCTAEVFVRAPATAQPSPNPDFLAFTNSLAANEVALAIPTVYKQLAEHEHVSVGVINSKIQILPSPGIGAFRVSYTDSDPARTKRIANAACSTFVGVVTKQRADEIDNDVKIVQDRLNSVQGDVKRLLAIPVQKRTETQALDLLTQQNALKINSFLIASLRSMPPDNISVLTPATGVTSTRSLSLKKALLVAAVAALLAIFLFILISEAVAPTVGVTPAAE